MFCPFACRHARRCIPMLDLPIPPYLAIVARTTAQLKMKPVIITNLDTSLFGHMVCLQSFPNKQTFSVD